MPLSQEKCSSCRRGAPKITAAEADQLKPTISDWTIIEIDSIQRLHRIFKVVDFLQAITLAGEIGKAAETEGHHPKITVEWGCVQVEWWTHKIKGLHRNDFIMAAKTDKIIKSTELGLDVS